MKAIYLLLDWGLSLSLEVKKKPGVRVQEVYSRGDRFESSIFRRFGLFRVGGWAKHRSPEQTSKAMEES